MNEQLLTACLAGDVAAQRHLYDRYAGAIYGVLLQMTSDQNRANDVLVRVFTHAFQNICAFTEAGHQSLFAWLLKHTREISLREGLSSRVTGAGDEAPALYNNQYIQHFTARLPVQSSQAFHLCYVKGLDTPSAARLLDRQEKEVKQSLLIAMVEFRKYLQSRWS